jgi:hypothetical protein
MYRAVASRSKLRHRLVPPQVAAAIKGVPTCPTFLPRLPAGALTAARVIKKKCGYLQLALWCAPETTAVPSTPRVRNR